MAINIKRIYEDESSENGMRILVDRMWPRGISKEKAKLDYWMKEIGPSNDLRKWFGHDPEKYEEFKEKYKEELTNGLQKDELEKLKGIANEQNKDILLLYGAKDKEHNQACVLKEILDNR